MGTIRISTPGLGQFLINGFKFNERKTKFYVEKRTSFI